MALKEMWKQFLDKYMKNPAGEIDILNFPMDETHRYSMIFSGLVQGVGFRYETWAIAQKLQLVGFVENLSNGDVYAEIQGPKNKVLYLIEYMKSIPRIHIEKLEMDEITIQEEVDFEIRN